jgi:hypothetical protein
LYFKFLLKFPVPIFFFTESSITYL